MSTATIPTPTRREPELLGQTVVVIGGSAGIGLETARRARAEGARLILTGRNPERLQLAADEFEALSRAAFDVNDRAALERFFADLPATIDHVMVTAGRPHYGRLLEMDLEEARSALDAHLLLMLQVARNAVYKVRPGGTLLFMGGTGGRRIGIGLGIVSTVTAALPALTASLAVELAPVRVNLIAAGFVDTPLSASLLGEELDNRRNQLRATLPIRRVVTPADVAALAIHIMSNTAITGATYDIDGGQQLVAG
ncbi:MAG TPA: SDR family oxidoreductase [Terracidiphilus sp.]|nr:SDR family oxidoreductase [Terracidiphilus sp.]